MDTVALPPDAIDPQVVAQLPSQITELLLSGGTLAEAQGYSPHDQEALYTLGHQLYSQGRYQEAMHVFGFLVTHNHLEMRYISAFASSLQMLQRYDEAIVYYSLVSLMDMSDPVPTFYTCQCLIATDRVEEARDGLDSVIAQCVPGQHDALRAKAQALCDLIDARKAPPGGAAP